MKNSFVKGPEGWCSYDYDASIVSGGRNIFILTTWEKGGGVNNSGYVWADRFAISDGRWALEPTRFTLKNDESLWHRSWAPSSASLDSLLANAHSFGFSFVGFAREVHGKLSMDEFEITLPGV